VAGAKVLGVVEDQVRGPKIRVFMKKRRKQMRRSHGFRADLTRVRVTSIVV
jgi:large subunit ribosomal protein L21